MDMLAELCRARGMAVLADHPRPGARRPLRPAHRGHAGHGVVVGAERRPGPFAPPREPYTAAPHVPGHGRRSDQLQAIEGSASGLRRDDLPTCRFAERAIGGCRRCDGSVLSRCCRAGAPVVMPEFRYDGPAHLSARVSPSMARRKGGGRFGDRSDLLHAVDGVSLPSTKAERPGSSARSAAARSRLRACSAGCSTRAAGRIVFAGQDIGQRPGVHALLRSGLRRQSPDGVPGPDRQPQSALHRVPSHRRSAATLLLPPRRQAEARPRRGGGARR